MHTHLTLRWKRRLRGWAGFFGTSRRACCWVNGNRVIVDLDDTFERQEWRCAPSVDAAMQWVERQVRDLVTYGRSRACELDQSSSWFVTSHGRAERRAVPVPRFQADVIAQQLRPNPLGDEPVVAKVIFKAERWAEHVADPYHGLYGSVTTVLYVEDGANRELVRDLAKDDLNALKRRHGLTPSRGA